MFNRLRGKSDLWNCDNFNNQKLECEHIAPQTNPINTVLLKQFTFYYLTFIMKIRILLIKLSQFKNIV